MTGNGVRAQVFEVIVRQALAGAPWREICAGPMEVNNINEEDVVREVHRRLNLGKDALSAKQKADLEKYVNQVKARIDPQIENRLLEKEEIKSAIASLYRIIGKNRPDVIFCDSPMMLFSLLSLYAYTRDHPKISYEELSKWHCQNFSSEQDEAFRMSLSLALESNRAIIKTGLGEALSKKLKGRFHGGRLLPVAGQIRKQLSEDLNKYLDYGLTDTMHAEISRLRTAVETTSNYIPFNGNPSLSTQSNLPAIVDALANLRSFDASIPPEFLGRFDRTLSVHEHLFGIWKVPDIIAWGFVQDHLSDDCPLPSSHAEELTIWRSMLNLAPWYSFFEKICFVGNYAQSVVFDRQRRLSNRSGPAQQFFDNFKIWAIEGIVVPEKLVTRPEELTAEEIESQTNVALRRIMIDTYGAAKFLIDVGAELIDKDEYGELYRKLMPDDEPIVVVCVTNKTMEPDGTYNRYFLRVPPTIRTAKEAVAWTFQMNSSEYSPDAES